MLFVVEGKKSKIFTVVEMKKKKKKRKEHLKLYSYLCKKIKKINRTIFFL
jgi:hypothetical protein